MSRWASIAATLRRLAGVTLLAACGAEPAALTNAPGRPLAGLSDAERARFLLGRALFERLATPEEGLGPLFNAERCSSCHGEPAPGGGGVAILVLKATRFDTAGCAPLHAEGGDNVQQRATPLLVAEGMTAEVVPPGATATRRVTAPPLFGLGLVEAVDEATLRGLADPDDGDGDGISGRLPTLPDGQPARFGRKGEQPTVRGFVESALIFEMGFTTDAHPAEEARNGVPVPAAADPTPDPEMDAETVALLTDYVRYLAPPTPAEPATATERERLDHGSRLFEAVGCARCHTPVLETGDAGEAALAHKALPLYSDLLLHDLGAGEGDVCTPQAPPGEYRTPPLWGLRHRTVYLHDGGATSLPEAIGRHGGEAAAAAAAYETLTGAARSALLAFLASR
jgi:CxxC motif-containing protein (DUF1111 family)